MANRTSEIAAEEVPGSPLRRSSRIATASPVPGPATIPSRRRSSASAEPTFPAAAKLTRTKRLSLSQETGDDRPSTPTKLTRARAGSKSPSQLENEKAPGTPSRRTRRSSITKIVEEEPGEVSPSQSQPKRSTRSQSKSPERPKRGRPSLALKQKKLEAIEETETKMKTETKKPATRGRRSSLSTRRGSTDSELEETAKQVSETKKVTRRSTRASSVSLEEVEENKTKLDLKAIEEDVEHEINSDDAKNVRKKSLSANEDVKLNDKENEVRKSLNKNQIESQKKDESKITDKEDTAKKTPGKRTSLKIDEGTKKSSEPDIKLQKADSATQSSSESQEIKTKTPTKTNLDQSKNSPKIEGQSLKNTPHKLQETPIKASLDQSKNSPKDASIQAKIEEQSAKDTPQKLKETPTKANLDQTKSSPKDALIQTKIEEQSLKNTPQKLKQTPIKSSLDESKKDTSIQTKIEEQSSKNTSQKRSETPIKANLDQSKNSPKDGFMQTKIEEQSLKNTPQKLKQTPIKSSLDESKKDTSIPTKIEEQSSKNTPQKRSETPMKANLDQSKNSPKDALIQTKVEEQISKNSPQKLKETPVKSNLDKSKKDTSIPTKIEEQSSKNTPQKRSETPMKANLDQSKNSPKDALIQTKVEEQISKNSPQKLKETPVKSNLDKSKNSPNDALIEANIEEESSKITPQKLKETPIKEKLDQSKNSPKIEGQSPKNLREKLSLTPKVLLDRNVVDKQFNKSITPTKLVASKLDLSKNDDEDTLQKPLKEDDSIFSLSLKVESDNDGGKLDSEEEAEVYETEIKSRTDKKLMHDKLNQVEPDSITINDSSSTQDKMRELNETQEEDISNVSKDDVQTISDLNESKENIKHLNKSKENIEGPNKSKESIEDLNKSHEKELDVSKNISKSETSSKKRKLCESINEDNKNKSFKSPKTKADSSLLANECEMTYGSDGSFSLILSMPHSDNSQDTGSEKKTEETLNTSTGSNNSDKENVHLSPAKTIKPLKKLDTSTSTPKTEVFQKSLSKSFDESRLEKKKSSMIVDDDEQLNELLDSFVDEVKDDENKKINTSRKLKIKEVINTEEKLDDEILELEEETGKQEKSFSKKRSKRRKIVISEEEEDEISSEGENLEEEEHSNGFIDDQAFEGEEDTPSEDSNEIIEQGESINSDDSDDESDDEDYENDSFVVDDEDLGLLSPEEIDDFQEVKKKKTRIIQVSSSDSDDELIGPVVLVDSDEDESKKINVLQDIKIPTTKSSAETEEGNLKDLEMSKPEVDEEDKKLKNTPIQDLKRTRKASLTISDINLSHLPEGGINDKITKAVDLICSTIKSSGNVSLNISVDYENDSNDGGNKGEAVIELKPQDEKTDEVDQQLDKSNRRFIKPVMLSSVKVANVDEETISQAQTHTDKLKRRSKKRDSLVFNTSTTDNPLISQEEAKEDDVLNISQSQADVDKSKRRSKKRDSARFEKSPVKATGEDEILSQSHMEASQDKSKRRSKKRDSVERRRSKSHNFDDENSSPSKTNETKDDLLGGSNKKSKLKKRDSLKNITHEDFKSDFEVEYVTSPELQDALNDSKIMSDNKKNIEKTVEVSKESKKKAMRRRSQGGEDTFEIENLISPSKKPKSSRRTSLQDQFEIDEADEIVQQKKRKSDEYEDEIIPDKKSKKLREIDVPTAELKPVEIKKKKKKKDKISPYINLDYIPQTNFEETVASPQKVNLSEVKSKKMKQVSVKPSKIRHTSGWDIEEAIEAKPSLKNEKKSEQQTYFEQIPVNDFKNRMIFDPSRIKRTNAKKLLKSKAKAMLMSNR